MRGLTRKALRAGRLIPGVMLAICTTAVMGDEEGSWPRTFANVDGSATTIPAPPQRILSTSVTITGTLLAIEAPLVASATSANGHFFAQWEEVARARGVRRLWPAGSVDLEAVYMLEPDLIVVSSSGADSALAQLPLLQAVAPTIVLDYGGQTWQSLARQLGEATGLEARVEARLAEFDGYMAQSRRSIRIPEGEANIISYNGPGAPNPIAMSGGVHGQLLQALGFTIESPDPGWQRNVNPAQDFVRSEYEHLTRMRAPATFLISAGDERAAVFLDDPILANLPSVQTGQVYGLGANSFRIDYYSATEVIDGIVERFGVNHGDVRRRGAE